MGNLEITAQEKEILVKLVGNYMSDLRMEIADTDQASFKKGLKEERETLNKLSDKLAAVEN